MRGSWTAKIVVCHIKNKFKVAYGASGALRLTKKMGFSVRYARPVPYNCATPEKQDEYICETVKMLKKYDGKRYKVACDGRRSLCGCALIDARHTGKRWKRHGQD